MSEDSIEKGILSFLKNRTEQSETTASRHIHRRFDIPMEQADKILSDLAQKNMIEEIYDKEYQERRYKSKK